MTGAKWAIITIIFIMPVSVAFATNEGADSVGQEIAQRPKAVRVLTREDKMRRKALRYMTARRKEMIKKALEKSEADQRRVRKVGARRMLTREDRMRRKALRYVTARRNQMIKKVPEKSEADQRRVHKTGTRRMLTREDKMRRSAIRYVMHRRKKMKETISKRFEAEAGASQLLIKKSDPQFFFIQNHLQRVPASVGAGKMTMSLDF